MGKDVSEIFLFVNNFLLFTVDVVDVFLLCTLPALYLRLPYRKGSSNLHVYAIYAEQKQNFIWCCLFGECVRAFFAFPHFTMEIFHVDA